MNGYSSLNNNPNFTFNGSNLRSYPNAHTGHGVEAKKINPSTKDYESYQTLDLRFNYNLKKKWNLLLNVPISKNSIYYNEVIQGGYIDDSLRIHQGLGDILIAIDKVATIENNNFKHTLKYGVGLFLPTGSIQKENNIDPAHYTGRGGFEPIIRASYSLKINQTWGIMANTSLATGTTFKTNDIDYHFGKRFNAQTNLFYSFNKGSSGFIPMLGLYYENISSDYANKVQVNGTSSKALFTNVSFGYSIKETMIRLEWQKPIHQITSDLQLYNSGRMNLTALHYF